ncbi:hypothetical protein K523DRAFT_412210 [Schizophyllum commune Tattone D]|nr:hypothetical protein K523DRAFT_412210 [Schizophyllum commune Tattone D]
MIEHFQRVKESFEICQHCEHEIDIEVNRPPEPHEDPALRAGLVPSAAEISSVKASIDETEGMLDTIAYELMYLEHIVVVLKYKQIALEELQDRQRAYIAPIRRLPNEILSEIFAYSCCDAAAGTYNCTPVKIGMICKQWRDIIYNCPRIWSHLRYNQVYVDAQECRWMRLCLRNSRGLPLRDPVKFSDDKHSLRIFNVMKDFSDQWTSLEVSPYLHSDSKSLCELLGDRPLSRLQCIESEALYLVRGDVHRVFERRAPALECVKLSVKRESATELPNLPWHQLVHIHLTCAWDYALRALAGCTRLESMILNLSEATTHDTSSLPHTRLSELHTAQITFSSLGGCRMLDFLDAPCLLDLSLTWPNKVAGPEAHSGTHLSHFLARSKCRLDRLQLHGIPASERAAVSSSFEGLRALTLRVREDMPLSDGDFAVLAAVAGDGTPAALKDLEYLNIGGPGRYRGDGILRLLEARREAHRPLKGVVLSIEDVTDLDYFDGEIDMVQRLEEETEPRVTVHEGYHYMARMWDRQGKELAMRRDSASSGSD